MRCPWRTRRRRVLPTPRALRACEGGSAASPPRGASWSAHWNDDDDDDMRSGAGAGRGDALTRTPQLSTLASLVTAALLDVPTLRTTKEYDISFSLDAVRNQLMTLELLLGVASLALCVSGAVWHEPGEPLGARAGRVGGGHGGGARQRARRCSRR